MIRQFKKIHKNWFIFLFPNPVNSILPPNDVFVSTSFPQRMWTSQESSLNQRLKRLWQDISLLFRCLLTFLSLFLLVKLVVQHLTFSGLLQNYSFQIHCRCYPPPKKWVEKICFHNKTYSKYSQSYQWDCFD